MGEQSYWNLNWGFIISRSSEVETLIMNDWQNLRAFSKGTSVVTDDSEMGLYFLGVLDSSL